MFLFAWQTIAGCRPGPLFPYARNLAPHNASLLLFHKLNPRETQAPLPASQGLLSRTLINWEGEASMPIPAQRIIRPTTIRNFGRFGDAVSGYWDLKSRVMEAVLTERPDWCDDPKRPG